ncbi:MAG: hypothetical protein OEM26_10315 [Saprospiraceae bacterium]|nr:hypothetical protein [Saprospiraceae bacterium]
MRLLAREHRDLLSALRQVGAGEGQFAFRKKSGWFNIDLKKPGTTFAFHRKKTTQLIDGQFEDSVKYRIRHDHKIREVAKWTEVLSAFQIWLARQVARGI